jgi:hypothetical protein
MQDPVFYEQGMTGFGKLFEEYNVRPPLFLFVLVLLLCCATDQRVPATSLSDTACVWRRRFIPGSLAHHGGVRRAVGCTRCHVAGAPARFQGALPTRVGARLE